MRVDPDPVQDDIERRLKKGKLFQQQLQAKNMLKGRAVKTMDQPDNLHKLFQHSSWQTVQKIS